jgi:hypothetical protein
MQYERGKKSKKNDSLVPKGQCDSLMLGHRSARLQSEPSRGYKSGRDCIPCLIYVQNSTFASSLLSLFIPFPILLLAYFFPLAIQLKRSPEDPMEVWSLLTCRLSILHTCSLRYTKKSTGLYHPNHSIFSHTSTYSLYLFIYMKLINERRLILHFQQLSSPTDASQRPHIDPTLSFTFRGA